MRKALYLLLILFTFTATNSFAKNDIGLSEKSNVLAKKKKSGGFDKNRLFFGGALGGGGTPGGFAFNVAPSIGYMLTDKFHVGINIGFLYAKQQFLAQDPITFEQFNARLRSTQLSTALFARYFVYDGIFIQARPEVNFLKDKEQLYDFSGTLRSTNNFNYNFPAALIGIGYAQRIGGGSYGFFSVSYDLVQNPNSVYYRQPVFGGGIALGLFGMR